MPIGRGHDVVLLDVALKRGDESQSWLITKWSMGWSFRRATGGTVEVNGVQTEDAMRERRSVWEAEIETARQEGWA